MITSLGALKKSLFSKGEKHTGGEAVHRGKCLRDSWPWAGRAWEAARSSLALSKVGATTPSQGLGYLMTSLPAAAGTARFALIAGSSGLLKY